jgi:hypothetical protein
MSHVLEGEMCIKIMIGKFQEEGLFEIPRPTGRKEDNIKIDIEYTS